MRFYSFISRTCILSSMVITWNLNPILNRPISADWCQCVIFLLNILGIDQIPGEYWTAESLAIPDEFGMTWMDYQGYSQRSPGEIPQTGDLLVLLGGAEVVTVQEWSGEEHLVPVPVDVWAGHIGIVLDAKEVEFEQKAYFQIRLLSANWGVNANYLGVVGSCYNVDSSEFLVSRGDDKAKFFHETDPRKMRERMVNRAERWSQLGLAENGNSTLDGFPVTPSGFVSHVMRPVGNEPLVPLIRDISAELLPIEPKDLVSGDIVVIGRENNPGFGFIVEPGLVTGTRTWTGSLIHFLPGGKVSATEEWTATLSGTNWVRVASGGGSARIRFFRYRSLPGYLFLKTTDPLRVVNQDAQQQLELYLGNGGGSSLTMRSISIDLYRISEEVRTSPKPDDQYYKYLNDNVFKAGESQKIKIDISTILPGNYRLLVKYTLENDQEETAGEVLFSVK